MDEGYMKKLEEISLKIISLLKECEDEYISITNAELTKRAEKIKESEETIRRKDIELKLKSEAASPADYKDLLSSDVTKIRFNPACSASGTELKDSVWTVVKGEPQEGSFVILKRDTNLSMPKYGKIISVLGDDLYSIELPKYSWIDPKLATPIVLHRDAIVAVIKRNKSKYAWPEDCKRPPYTWAETFGFAAPVENEETKQKREELYEYQKQQYVKKLHADIDNPAKHKLVLPNSQDDDDTDFEEYQDGESPEIPYLEEGDRESEDLDSVSSLIRQEIPHLEEEEDSSRLSASQEEDQSRLDEFGDDNPNGPDDSVVLGRRPASSELSPAYEDSVDTSQTSPSAESTGSRLLAALDKKAKGWKSAIRDQFAVSRQDAFNTFSSSGTTVASVKDSPWFKRALEMGRPMPTTIPPPRVRIFRTAVHDIGRPEGSGFNFKRGDEIEILNTDDPEWWYGRVKGTTQSGYFLRYAVTQSDASDSSSDASAESASDELKPKDVLENTAFDEPTSQGVSAENASVDPSQDHKEGIKRFFGKIFKEIAPAPSKDLRGIFLEKTQEVWPEYTNEDRVQLISDAQLETINQAGTDVKRRTELIDQYIEENWGKISTGGSRKTRKHNKHLKYGRRTRIHSKNSKRTRKSYSYL